METDTLNGGETGHATLNDPGGQHVFAETSRRMGCEAALVLMQHAVDGTVDVGRRTRTIPAAIRRALTARDGRCRFPGCTARRCDAHHIEHWADGGATRLDNLALLCRRHHTLVHEGGWTMARRANGDLAFVRPDGRALPHAPDPPERDGNTVPLPPTIVRDATAGTAIDSLSTMPARDGTSLDVGWALDVLRTRPAGTVRA